MQSIDTTKYIINTKINAEGVIEKPDIVGAIFGQTEGLLGADLDLRELQKTGRIGRIEVIITTQNGKTNGNIFIPSSLDKIKTSILAASLETIERVGPCVANIEIIKIEDIRSIKRTQIIERAKVIYSTMFNDDTLESKEISDIIKEAVKIERLTYFGKNKIPAGPHYNSQDLTIVEGRADVLTLLKYGIKNTLSVGGTNIPLEVIDFIKNKNITIFTDSDRGGELIIKELLQISKIDYIAKPPFGKSVEDLVQKEVILSLRHKIPIKQYIENFKEDFKNLTQNDPSNKFVYQYQELKNETYQEKIKEKSLLSISTRKKIIKRAPKIIKKNLLFLTSGTAFLNKKDNLKTNYKPILINENINEREKDIISTEKKKQLIFININKLNKTLKTRILT